MSGIEHSPEPVPGPAWTADEFASRYGMTKRNIREWQTLKLLPCPVRRGRVAFYGKVHADRMERIQQLKADGFPLNLIGKLLTDSTHHPTVAEELAHAVLQPAPPNRTTVLTHQQITEQLDLTTLHALAQLGAVSELPDGQWSVHSPAALAAVGELLTLGFTVEDLTTAYRTMQTHHAAIARVILKGFNARIWQPFVAAGMPPERWQQLGPALNRLRPLMIEVVTAESVAAVDQATRHAIANGVQLTE